jgi:uncharacterized C2H2 Zn-finger protein
MPGTVHCPHCGARLRHSTPAAPSRARCPQCGTIFNLTTEVVSESNPVCQDSERHGAASAPKVVEIPAGARREDLSTQRCPLCANIMTRYTEYVRGKKEVTPWGCLLALICLVLLFVSWPLCCAAVILGNFLLPFKTMKRIEGGPRNLLFVCEHCGHTLK